MYTAAETRAGQILAAGGVVVHATEGVFGIAASAFDQKACQRVAHIKGRPSQQKFIVIGADFAQLAQFVHFETDFREDIFASWPGPNTWVLPARKAAPWWLLSDNDTLAVRIPGHAQARRLCSRAGPLTSTSANRHGHKPANSLFNARRGLKNTVDFYLPGRLGGNPGPSTIRDGLSGEVFRH